MFSHFLPWSSLRSRLNRGGGGGGGGGGGISESFLLPLPLPNHARYVGYPWANVKLTKKTKLAKETRVFPAAYKCRDVFTRFISLQGARPNITLYFTAFSFIFI